MARQNSRNGYATIVIACAMCRHRPNQTREERTQGTVPKKDKDKYKPLTDFMKE